MKRKSLIWGLLFFPLSYSLAQIDETQIEQPQIPEGLIQVHDLFNATDNPDIACYRIPVMICGEAGTSIL